LKIVLIDLHTHSTASDGTLSPSELVALAAERGLSLIGLTDHDTVGGLPEFFEALSRTRTLQGIGGLEISAVHGPYHVHLIGYGAAAQPSAAFARRLDEFAQSRTRRGEAIVERLRELGADITLDEVWERATGKVVGRPHVAQVLVAKGLVRDTDQAFRDYLGVGGPAYVERDRPTAIEAVEVLRQERMVPVLAHPPTLNAAPDDLDRLVHQLHRAGLMGVECYYPTYSRQDAGLCHGLADRHGLLRTGGSDFHGACRPDIALGTGKGNLRVPEALGAGLLRAIASIA
jgi:predicted metal-dependent phosphoesterase TrpH